MKPRPLILPRELERRIAALEDAVRRLGELLELPVDESVEERES